MQIEYIGKKTEAPGIETFYFKPEKPVRYIAGQFIEIYVPHEQTDDRGIRRWFTLSSSPSEPYLALTTRIEELKPSSFKNTLINMKPGTQLKALTPMGDFVVPKKNDIPLVFVAVGMGITPFRSILKDLKDKNDSRDIQLIYKPRSAVSAAFLFEIQKFLPNSVVTYDALTAAKVLELAEISNEHYVYLSGPEPLVEKIENDLKKAGVNDRHVFTDFFLNYSEA